MKTFFPIVGLVFASFVGSFAPAVQAAPNSPVGDWDFVIGGKQRGVSLMTFNEDYTLDGTEIIRPAPFQSSSSSSSDLRTGGLVSSRDGSIAPGGSNSVLHTAVGGNHLTGIWTYDAAGKVIGIINEIHSVLTNETFSVTNVVDGTNLVTSTNALVFVEVTNGTSFRAVVSLPGSTKAHMILLAYNDRGTSTFRGVPLAALPDLTGDYSAFGRKPGHLYVEFFTFQPDLEFPNSYFFTDGMGPAYVFHGRAILSRQKQLALYTWTDNDPLNPVVTAYSGPFNAIKRTGTLRGIDTANAPATYKIAPRP